ncbi:hypothetical protein VTN77DRAFT_6642 [Rasamsonia byssochlamydoides]|uniref:uncharacterized protein n=1 Tax=Rasamsonia byssochlamydoides TaxID=89139 RepID=UPI003744AC2C
MSPLRIRIREPQALCHKNSPNFYAENTFQIDEPDFALEWLQKITTPNVRSLRKLWIYVHPVYHGTIWYNLFNKLATEAVSLQEISIYLDSEPTCGYWGPAVDVNFVRALARISNLRKLEIDGYFPKEWPIYLEEKTGLKVWQAEKQGIYNEGYLSALREFQRRLKDQHP